MSKSTLDRTHQARILVVDDEAEVRLLLAREISDRGHEVVAAADGDQAVQEMDRGDFDVVLTDVRMPGMDGMGLTEWIKRTRPDTDVIIMTGYASVESAATAVRLDAFDYLLKPFGEMDLITSSIDRAIQKRRLEEDLRWNVEELRASRTSFRSVVETNSDGIVIVDRRGNVRFANPAVKNLLNRKVEELIGGPFGLPVVAGETTAHEVIGRGGERRITEIRVVETEWEGEIAYLASLRDITERKDAEELIHRHRRREDILRDIGLTITSTLDLRSVLEILLDKIDLHLPYAAVTVRLLNRQSGEFEPVACRNINVKDWRAESGRGFLREMMESKAAVISPNVQTDPRARDPKFFRKHGLVSFLAIPMIAKGEILGALSFYTSEEHQFNKEEIEFLSTLAGHAAIAIHNSQLYEHIKEQAVELKKANKVKSEFLRVMSHELRTPLCVIMGYTKLMKERMLGDINQKQEGVLGKLLNQSNDLLTMITSVLETTSMEAETVKVENHPFGLVNFLDWLKAVYEVPLDKDVALTWDYPFNLPVMKTDSGKLNQILRNLINNAVKFTEKGSVTVSARYFPGTETLEFKVADTGIGIPKESLPLIFEKFRQLDSSDTRSHGGVGLGLYIVKQFTEMLGGTVTTETEPGRGSTFVVTVPIKPKSDPIKGFDHRWDGTEMPNPD